MDTLKKKQTLLPISSPPPNSVWLTNFNFVIAQSSRKTFFNYLKTDPQQIKKQQKTTKQTLP